MLGVWATCGDTEDGLHDDPLIERAEHESRVRTVLFNEQTEVIRWQ